MTIFAIRNPGPSNTGVGGKTETQAFDLKVAIVDRGTKQLKFLKLEVFKDNNFNLGGWYLPINGKRIDLNVWAVGAKWDLPRVQKEATEIAQQLHDQGQLGGIKPTQGNNTYLTPNERAAADRASQPESKHVTLGGAQITFTPLSKQGKQWTWRVDVEKNGQPVGSFETKFSGQLGTNQLRNGSPLKKQIMRMLQAQKPTATPANTQPAWMNVSTQGLTNLQNKSKQLLNELNSNHSQALASARAQWNQSNGGLLNAPPGFIPLGAKANGDLFRKQRATIEAFKAKNPGYEKNPVLNKAVQDGVKFSVDHWIANNRKPGVVSPGAWLSGAWDAAKNLSGYSTGELLGKLITDPQARAAAWKGLTSNAQGLNNFVNDVMQGNFESAARRLSSLANNAAIAFDPKTPQGQQALISTALAIVAAANKPATTKPKNPKTTRTGEFVTGDVKVGNRKQYLKNSNLRTLKQKEIYLEREFPLQNKVPENNNPGTRSNNIVPLNKPPGQPPNTTATKVGTASQPPNRQPSNTQAPTGTVTVTNPQVRKTIPVTVVPQKLILPETVLSPNPAGNPVVKPAIIPAVNPELNPKPDPAVVPNPVRASQQKVKLQATPEQIPGVYRDNNGYAFYPDQAGDLQRDLSKESERGSREPGGHSRYYFLQFNQKDGKPPKRREASADEARKYQNSPRNYPDVQYVGVQKPQILISSQKEVIIAKPAQERSVLNRTFSSYADFASHLQLQTVGGKVVGLKLPRYQGADLSFSQPVSLKVGEARLAKLAKHLYSVWNDHYKEALDQINSFYPTARNNVKINWAKEWATTKLDLQLRAVDPGSLTSTVIANAQQGSNIWVSGDGPRILVPVAAGIGSTGVVLSIINNFRRDDSKNEIVGSIVKNAATATKTDPKNDLDNSLVAVEKFPDSAEFNKKYAKYLVPGSRLLVFTDGFLTDPTLVQQLYRDMDMHYDEQVGKKLTSLIRAQGLDVQKFAERLANAAFWQSIGVGNTGVVDQGLFRSFVDQYSLQYTTTNTIVATINVFRQEIKTAIAAGTSALNTRTARDSAYSLRQLKGILEDYAKTQADALEEATQTQALRRTDFTAGITSRTQAKEEIQRIKNSYNSEESALKRAIQAIQDQLDTIDQKFSASKEDVPKQYTDLQRELTERQRGIETRLYALPVERDRAIRSVSNDYTSDLVKQMSALSTSRIGVTTEFNNNEVNIRNFEHNRDQAIQQAGNSGIRGANDVSNLELVNGWWIITTDFLRETVEPLSEGAVSQNSLDYLVRKDENGVLQRKSLNSTRSEIHTIAEYELVQNKQQELKQSLNSLDLEIEKLTQELNR